MDEIKFIVLYDREDNDIFLNQEGRFIQECDYKVMALSSIEDCIEVFYLIDTGSTYSIISEELAYKLGFEG